MYKGYYGDFIIWRPLALRNFPYTNHLIQYLTVTYPNEINDINDTMKSYIRWFKRDGIQDIEHLPAARRLYKFSKPSQIL